VETLGVARHVAAIVNVGIVGRRPRGSRPPSATLSISGRPRIFGEPFGSLIGVMSKNPIDVPPRQIWTRVS